MLWRRQKDPEAPTFLNANSEFQGNLNTDGNLRVDGIIHGTVEVQGDVEIAEGALVEGEEIRANNLTIHGAAKARIVVTGRLTLTRTAHLEGDVIARALNIEPGAFYVGHITTTDAKALPGSPSLYEFASHEPESAPRRYPSELE